MSVRQVWGRLGWYFDNPGGVPISKKAKARHEKVELYCQQKHWDVNSLTNAQVLEIGEQPWYDNS